MKLSLTLLSLLLLVACHEPNTTRNNSGSKTEREDMPCVKRILKKDSILGKVRNEASKTITVSETINNYATDLKSLDYTHCPEEFKRAFDEHVEAWLAITAVTDRYPLMRGELHDLFTQLEESEDSTEFKSYVKKIWDTWEKVEKNSN